MQPDRRHRDEAERTGLSVSVFGDLTAHRDGVSLDLGGVRQRAVLALLLVARGAPVTVDRMVEGVWAGCPPAQPGAALQSYVSHLRRVLEPDRPARERGLLTWRPAGYSCHLPADAVDVRRFERLVAEGVTAGPSDAVDLLTAALALYRGDPFQEWAGQPWADAECARLAELREVAVEHLLDARLEAGEPAAVLVPELEVLTAAEPLREERWRLLALALYRASRQSDALAALRRARRVLSDELGIEPGPALRELEQQVLAQAPALDGARTGRGAVPDPAPASPSPVPETGMVERDGELVALQGALDAALGGVGSTVLVEGPAGIGKSRLLAEVRRMAAARGARVVTARGTVLEQDFGFGVVRQLLEPLVTDPGAPVELLEGVGAPAAGVFSASPGSVGEEGPRRDGVFAVLHALYRIVGRLSDARPVVLVVDDVQWCDTDSLRFLAYLVPRLEGLPVLLAASLRTGEFPADRALVTELAGDPAVQSVRPAPLSASGVADLVGARLGRAPAPAFLAACHRTTRGNPLLLQQLVRALQSDGVPPDASHADTVTAIGSRAVSGIVLLRLGRLPEQAGAVARAVAVLGDGTALPEVASLAAMSEAEAGSALAALAAAEIISRRPPLSFVHPLVREAVHRSLLPGERELAHERAVRVLGAAGASPEQLAAHVLLVPPRGDPAVAQVLREAARIAAERGAVESAARYLRRLLDELRPGAERVAVLSELGGLEALTDGAAALGHLREAHRSSTDPADRARTAVRLAFTLVFAGPRGEVVRFAERAAAEVPDDAGPELHDVRQALLALARVGGHMHAVPPSGPGAEDLPPPTGDGPGARMLAAATAWELVVTNRDRSRCAELARRALTDGRLLADDPGLFWVVAAFVLDIVGEDVEPFWDTARDFAHRRGSLFAALSTHLWHGHASWWAGDLPAAEASLMTAIDQSQRWAAPAVGISYGEAFVVGVRLDRGDTAGARAFFDAHGWRSRLGDGARLWAEAEVVLLLSEGRPREALDRLDSDATLLAAGDNPVWAPWRSLRAAALGALGRHQEAVETAEEEVRLARAWGAPRVLGRSLRVLGEVSGAGGEEALRESVSLLAGTRSRLELARAQAALARLAPRAEAVALLEAAERAARLSGAAGLQAELSAELSRRCASRSVVPGS
ncbi:BTAD domain-containing putative transcriptional regulator [Modestobacter sp. SSW1-42]|uniref:BTAD domain-containing putative transcriptional regulator n=1 Tax=Modestobacter sp. SSW1-42 TaxID=596372 RepID=UPI003986F2C3